jgi:hypothetical protein
MVSLRTLLSDQLPQPGPAPAHRPNWPWPSSPRLFARTLRSPASGISDNELVFSTLESEDIGEAIELFKSQGRSSAVICAEPASAKVADRLFEEFARHDLPRPAIANPSRAAALAQERDGLFLAFAEAPKLSALLRRFAKARDTFIWGAKTRHYFKSRPVFVQSVPKAGTHAVFECLKAFGYAEPPGLDLPDFEAPLADGVFYNLQHMPIACLSSRKIPHFIRSLSGAIIIFIVRDPRDIAVSLAYGIASPAMPLDERLGRVVAGEYPDPIYLNRYLNLSCGIRELFATYLAWWRAPAPNIWRLRYEDIIGPEGGGDIERQLQAIWELQLALHVPGRPADYCDRIFSPEAPTFRRGQIGDHLLDFKEQHHELFAQSAGDLLDELGYADRWQFARAFSVLLPSAHELSAPVAWQLRSELASHGRGFSSIAISADGSHPSSPQSQIEVAASGVETAANQDRARVTVEMGESVRGTMIEQPTDDGSRYTVRIREIPSAQALAKAIVDALVKIGFVERLPGADRRHNPNLLAEDGARPDAAEANRSLSAEAAAPPVTPVKTATHDKLWLQIRATMDRLIHAGEAGSYRSAQVD